MITFKNAGYAGRVGNTLFQFAALFGIANKLGLDFGIPYENAKEPTKLGYYDFFTNEWIHYRFDLLDVFEITAKDIPVNYKNTQLYYEKHFQFDENVFKLESGTDINGWFQSYKYFEHCEKELRQELTFKQDFINRAALHYICLPDMRKETLMISMRIGDGYEFDKNFATTNLAYYKSALEQFNLDNYNIAITSDDPIRCKQILKKIIGKRQIFVLDEKCPYTTLAFYARCDHYIIPNSTFTWWGSFFGTNPNKKVIIPRNWFNAKVDTSDMSPKEWIRI